MIWRFGYDARHTPGMAINGWDVNSGSRTSFWSITLVLRCLTSLGGEDWPALPCPLLSEPRTAPDGVNPVSARSIGQLTSGSLLTVVNALRRQGTDRYSRDIVNSFEPFSSFESALTERRWRWLLEHANPSQLYSIKGLKWPKAERFSCFAGVLNFKKKSYRNASTAVFEEQLWVEFLWKSGSLIEAGLCLAIQTTFYNGRVELD